MSCRVKKACDDRATSARSWVSSFAVVCALLFFIGVALAETVEVAPGVKVTKKVYPAPVNEQPFYGFFEKSAAIRDADERFLTGIVQLTGSRERAPEETTLRGWRALIAGNSSEPALFKTQARCD